MVSLGGLYFAKWTIFTLQTQFLSFTIHIKLISQRRNLRTFNIPRNELFSFSGYDEAILLSHNRFGNILIYNV